MDSESRPAPRYPFIAEAEVTEIISGTKLGARTSDVSTSGCYLDTLNPSLKGSEIQIRIFHASGTFTALGRVVFVVPNMGMGVVFTTVEDTQLAILQEWLSELIDNESNAK
jgi:hypothetical protein